MAKRTTMTNSEELKVILKLLAVLDRFCVKAVEDLCKATESDDYTGNLVKDHLTIGGETYRHRLTPTQWDQIHDAAEQGECAVLCTVHEQIAQLTDIASQSASGLDLALAPNTARRRRRRPANGPIQVGCCTYPDGDPEDSTMQQCNKAGGNWNPMPCNQIPPP